MRKVKVKKTLALLMAASIALPPAPFTAAAEETGGEVTIPDPYYEFTFDEEGDGTDGIVNNIGSKKGITATIEGDKEGLGIVEDESRGNNVLNLPGGDTKGKKEGRLTLPDDMFADVTDAGFAFSFWINIDGNAGQYSRIFSGTVNGQNSDNGGGNWNAPEFAFVAGSDNATDMGSGQGGYHTSVLFPDNGNKSENKLYLVWNKQFSKDTWQHVTISVSKDSYDVYLDGENIGIKYDRNNNTKAFLGKLFENNASILKQYRYCAIGASVYKTDTDLKAKMDEFRFYNVALTEEQAKKAYDNYKVSDEVIKGLQDKVTEFSQKSISFYTKESYEIFAKALSEAEKGIANPVTVANVERLIRNLEEAAAALEFYPGIDENTTFSIVQLEEGLEEAEGVLAAGGLSAESEIAIQAAIDAAKAAKEGTDQKAADYALIALRTALEEKTYGATLNFDAAPENRKTPLLHGSTGFLYGVSEVNVPSADLLAAISPKILVQKAADGQQHPSGDGYRLANYLKSCGVENIQIYLQDYYLEWPYEYDKNDRIGDYNKKVITVLTKMFDKNGDGELSEEEKNLSEEELSLYSFVIFNEPDNIWYSNSGGGFTNLCNEWRVIYKTIKGINPGLKVAGPNFASYNTNAYNKFLEFCKNNDCLPEYITWHELQKDKLTSYKQHCDEIKGYVDKYYKDSGIEPILFVNETVNFEDVGTPGILVNWLAVFDEEDVYASLPYWGLANSLNELAADANKPNGAWWIYKWYAQMTGDKMPLELENIGNPGPHGRLYGLSSVDDKNSTIHSLFGGQAGKQRVCIKNITQTETFKGADKAHVKIYTTKYTGHHGFADDIPVEFEGNIAFSGDDLSFTITGSDLMDAYYAVITPATEEEVTTISGYNKNWEKTYEAEDAKLIGGAEAFKKEGAGSANLARSNRAEVGGLNSENDGVEFSVEVPSDGKYRLNIYYTSKAPNVDAMTLKYVTSGGQNRAIGKLSSHTLSVDGGEPQEVVYDSTVKWGYYNYKTVYLDLTKGEHTLTLMYKGENQNGKSEGAMLCALLDKIDLSYVAKEEREICIEPEELTGIQEGFSLSQEGEYSGAGTAFGSGDFDFYVNAPEDGFYSFETTGNGNAVLSKSKVNYASDAKAESEISISWMELFNVVLGESSQQMVYLTAGMNHLCLTGNNMVLDKLVFTQVPDVTKENTNEIEAEDCNYFGTEEDDGYTYLRGSSSVPKLVNNKYASGGKVVEGFRGGKDNSLSLEVDVPETGNYKLSVFYSNNEPAPVMKKQNGDNYVHPYNTDLVERYMQISVNDGTPQTVYFRNTLCWDTFKNTIVDVELSEGANTITFTNDNSYKFSAVQDDFTPRLDKFVIAKATIIAPKPSEEAGTPVITKQPESASYKKGDTAAALAVEASVNDGGTLSYQWYKNTADSTEGAEKIAGADGSSYTPSTAETGTVYYYCKVTNTKGTSSKAADSSIAKVTVTESSVVPSDGYTVTYRKNVISNAEVSAYVIGKEGEFESGSKVNGTDKVKIVITPEKGYTFAEAPQVTAAGATAGMAEIKGGVYTFVIHTFKADTDIAISGKTAEVQYSIAISKDALQAAKDKHVTAGMDIESVCADSKARLILTPEKGYNIESAIATKKEDTCTVSGWERGANGIYIINLSKFTGNTEISNINIEVSETKVYEHGTDTSVNTGAANISETTFTKEDADKIIGAVTDEEFIETVIDINSGKELSGDDKSQAVKDVTDAIENGGKVEMSLEVSEEENIGTDKENDVKDILEKEAVKDAENKTGGKAVSSKAAMPLDISLFAKVVGTGVKILLKDTNTKKMVIKMSVPYSIAKEAEGITRSYYVVRFHGGKKSNIACRYDKAANTIKFESDKFSTYVLCYVDTKKSSNNGNGGGGAVIAPYPVITPSPSPAPCSTPAPGSTAVPAETPAPGGVAVPTETPAPVVTPAPGTPAATETPAPGVPGATKTPSSTAAPAGTTKLTVKNAVYRLVSSGSKKTAVFSGAKKNVKKVVIPASIKAGNKIYKVTAISKNALKGNKKITKVVIGANISKIGKNAFKGCSKLKKIIVKSKKLKMKNVGENAFKGINKKAVIKVPKGKVKLYKKIVHARGAGKKVKTRK